MGQNILSGRSMKQQEKVSSVGTYISSFHSSRRPTSTSTSTQFNRYDSLSDVGEIRVYQRADFQSGSRVLKKVF